MFYTCHDILFIQNFQKNILPLFNRNLDFTTSAVYKIIKRSTLSPTDKKQYLHVPLKNDTQKITFIAKALWYATVTPNLLDPFGPDSAASPPIFLMGCEMPPPCDHFCGRTAEIKKLHELLLIHKKLFVCGLPGIGKTEVAKRYAQYYSQKKALTYLNTFYISYSGSLKESITNLIFDDDAPIIKKYNTLQNRLLKQKSQHLESELEELSQAFHQELYDAHTRHLKQLGPDTLLVIDNFNMFPEADPALSDVLSYPFHVLFTSRCRFENMPHLELQEMQDLRSQHTLIQHFYPEAPAHWAQIDKIISTVHHHTLLIELVGRLLGYGCITPEDLLQHIEVSHIYPDLCDPIRILKDNHPTQKTYKEHLRILFPLFQLHETQQDILRNLSLLPDTGLPLIKLKEWLNLNGPPLSTQQQEYIYALNELIDKGIVQHMGPVISLHGLIRDLIIAEPTTRPSIQKCSILLHNLIIKCHDTHDPLPDRDVVFQTAVNICRYVDNDDSEFYREFLKTIYLAMRRFMDYSGMETVLMVWRSLCKGSSPTDEMLFHFADGMVSQDLDQILPAYKSFLDCLAVCPTSELENQSFLFSLQQYGDVLLQNYAAEFDQVKNEKDPEIMIYLQKLLQEPECPLEVVDYIRSHFSKYPILSRLMVRYFQKTILRSGVNCYLV